MSPHIRNFGHPARGGAIVLAAATFVLGLAVGAVVGPRLSGEPATAKAEPSSSVRPSSQVNTVGPVRTIHPAEVVRVVDGDTFEARVQVWPGIQITTKVRLRDIDAPEMRANCPAERSKAEAARQALRMMLDEGGVSVGRVSLDKYGGRVLADASTRMTPDVSAVLLAKGLARPYSGGRRESWCGQEALISTALKLRGR